MSYGCSSMRITSLFFRTARHPLLRRGFNSKPFASRPFGFQTLCRHETRRDMSQSLRSTPTSTRGEPLAVGSNIRGESGQVYRIDKVLSDRREVRLFVYEASAAGKTFIVKNMIPGEFEYQLKLQQPLASRPNIRAVVDTVPEGELFIFPFLAGHLLRLAALPDTELEPEQRKNILREALTGLAELHDRGIVHNDIKPNNILIDYEGSPGKPIKINSVQISDLEDCVILPPGRCIKGCISGNQFWRSPEAWARAKQSHASDVFSFGVVAIYGMYRKMMFYDAGHAKWSQEEAWQHILGRHISYCADAEAFEGFLRHIGEENPLFQPLIDLVGAVTPMNPIRLWQGIDAEFRDLVGKMMNMDPSRRITAREALGHLWFQSGAGLGLHNVRS